MELLCLPLGMRSLDRPGAEHMLGLRHQRLLPVLDLIRVHLELIGQIDQGTLASNAANAPLALKTGEWFRRFLCVIFGPSHLDGNLTQKIPLSDVDQLAS